MDRIDGIPGDYDLVVIGSGEGGKFLAWTLAREGKRVIVVERKYIGGACPNIACLPSKNIVHSAKVASFFARSEEFGITKDNVRLDMSVVRERKRKMVSGLVDMHLANFKSSGAELLMGSARFVAPKTVEVSLNGGGTRVVRGENVVLGLGSRAKLPEVPGLIEAAPLTHVEALELDRVPEHLLILGGGYVGLELGQAMRRFGSKVTVIDHNPRLVHHEDEDVSAALQDLFRDEGIDLALGGHVRAVEGKSGEAVRVRIVRDGAENVVEGSHILVAAGRLPNTENMGFEHAGVELTDSGHIKVNERLQTTAPGVWALGDCAGSPHFTHISLNDFRVVRDNIAGREHVTTGRQVPFCMFTDPELARIGLSESEAKAQGVAYRVAKVPMAAVLRTRTLSETRGFMKVLIGADDRILGLTSFSVGAGEIMGAAQIAMIGGLSYTTLRDAVLTHPTLIEGFIPLLSAVPPAGKSSAQSE